MSDRSWMTRRGRPDRIGVSLEFRLGVEKFLEFAYEHPSCVYENEIRCPCRVCMNSEWKSRDDVQFHLFNKGFMPGYTRWTQHGEPFLPGGSSSSVEVDIQGSDGDNLIDMVFDAAGPALESGVDFDNVDEDPNVSAKDFYQMLNDLKVPLYSGHKIHSKLSVVCRLLHIKSESGLSEKHFNDFLAVMKECLPEDNQLPENYYYAKKMVKGLGLGYQKIEACREDCTLYWGENKDKSSCPKCGLSRYQPSNGSSKKEIPWKILRYLPIAPRLQRLYMSNKTSKHMRWHGTQQSISDEMRHPADGEAWKDFNLKHPSFAQDIRNVRLGLATDGFTPFLLSNKPYSTWPVFIVPYNLPPDMCMKDPYMYLTLIIPGPQAPGKDIDIYLQPLIHDLKMLWENGIDTYDSCLKKNFQMRAALLWTINDFPAYGVMEGWCTHGKMACPICKDATKAISLKHSRKLSWFGTLRKFLPINHIFRTRKDKAHITVEKNGPPPRLSGYTVKMQVDRLQFPPLGKPFKDKTAEGYGTLHNYTKKSIFFDLPYWSSLLLRHNLDVMHIEKNVFDNVFNTVMNVPGKTKDHLRARMDMQEMGIQSELHPKMNKRGNKMIMPKASFSLTGDQIKQVCEWVKQLRLPDGYASNISHCCNLKDCKFYGLKSHDCHVFMERLLPIAFRGLLPKDVMGALTDLGLFFRDLCSTVLKKSDMEILEKNINITMSKLEKIFPPSFFNVMEHLPIHLAYEAEVGGPVQYRWMYPFERCMHRLKNKVKNKAHVEGSIAEAYIIEELVNFCSLYFDVNQATKHNRPSRNADVGDIVDNNQLEIFKHPGRPISKGIERVLTDDEYVAATFYVLMNCTEVQPFIDEFDQEIHLSYPRICDEQMEEVRNKNFVNWFKARVLNDADANENLKRLARGPSKSIYAYKGYMVNGFKFHTSEWTANKKTQNDGVLVQGSYFDARMRDFYGRLEEIVELRYLGENNHVVLFKCEWYDNDKGVREVHPRVWQVNLKSRLQVDEPFILASQASQCVYVKSVTKNEPNWYNVIKTKARSSYDFPAANGNDMNDDTYQEDNIGAIALNQSSDDIFNVDLRVQDEPRIEIEMNVLQQEDKGEDEDEDVFLHQNEEDIEGENGEWEDSEDEMQESRNEDED